MIYARQAFINAARITTAVAVVWDVIAPSPLARTPLLLLSPTQMALLSWARQVPRQAQQAQPKEQGVARKVGITARRLTEVDVVQVDMLAARAALPQLRRQRPRQRQRCSRKSQLVKPSSPLDEDGNGKLEYHSLFAQRSSYYVPVYGIFNEKLLIVLL